MTPDPNHETDAPRRGDQPIDPREPRGGGLSGRGDFAPGLGGRGAGGAEPDDEPDDEPRAASGAGGFDADSADAEDGGQDRAPADGAARELRDQSDDMAAPLPHELEGSEVAGLVAQAKDGDSEALNELFRRYYGLLVEVARRRLGPRLKLKEDPDDLAQTAFREATRDFHHYRYQGDGSLVRWLIQILNNKIRDRAEFYSASKRDMSRERTIEGSSDGEESPRTLEPQSPDLSVTRQVSRDEEFLILRKGLERLSPEHRQAITLVFFQGLSLRQAGEQMGGRTEDAVRMMLRRAEARLKDIVSGRLEPED